LFEGERSHGSTWSPETRPIVPVLVKPSQATNKQLGL
jgi:hypothetical protein